MTLEHLKGASMDDKLRDSFERDWICQMQTKPIKVFKSKDPSMQVNDPQGKGIGERGHELEY